MNRIAHNRRGWIGVTMDKFMKKLIIDNHKLDNNIRVRSTMAFVHTFAQYVTLYSYQSFVCSYNKNTHELEVDYGIFDCSNTTRRHFSEFLHTYTDMTYQDVKRAKTLEKKARDNMYIPEPTGNTYMYRGFGVTFV